MERFEDAYGGAKAEPTNAFSPQRTLDLQRFGAGHLSVKRSPKETEETIKHSEEFKHEAVRIVLASGVSRDRAASDLAIGKSTLGKGGWQTIVPLTWCRRRKSTSLWRTNGCALRIVS